MATKGTTVAFGRGKVTGNGKTRYDSPRDAEVQGSIYLEKGDERAESETLDVTVSVPAKK